MRNIKSEGENPTDLPYRTPPTRAAAAEMIEAVARAAEPALSGAELATLDAVRRFLTGPDSATRADINTGPSPYPTDSAASYAHCAASGAALAAERATDEATTRDLARLGAEAQAIAEELGGEGA